ncbi:uncharacterized protein LOC131927638 [Physella acuta]|uniref:uncharacterized protein LOC131927638 n=1 Tax=Physella acuta TaxID=109671 RepID=UPI0027DB611B|nr:uncharacterized protein LOC131927638 [Physella acuta]XP_059139376.1 uncharacterized protein LOC131927638 [Physella acuta]XP_059139378.1 uncharacterized protein LOC131927638 [Physella acuta]XP_059139379.1 uncharacterized protein LOC131927638 [Physella acuta]
MSGKSVLCFRLLLSCFLLIVVESGTTQYPPDLPPVVVVYNKTVTDGQTIQVNTTTTRDVDIACTVEGGSPAVTNVTLTCDGSSTTSNGYSGFFTLTFGNSSRNVRCTCSADHVTGLYSKKTSFTFITGPSYPPSLPPVVVVYNKTVTAGETIQLNTSNTKVNIECTVEGGNPEVFSVTLVCGDKSSTVLGNSGMFTLTYGNQKIIPCVCSAFHFSLYNKTTSFTLSTVNNAKNQSLGPSIVWNISLLALVILAKTAIL